MQSEPLLLQKSVWMTIARLWSVKWRPLLSAEQINGSRSILVGHNVEEIKLRVNDSQVQQLLSLPTRNSIRLPQELSSSEMCWKGPFFAG